MVITSITQTYKNLTQPYINIDTTSMSIPRVIIEAFALNCTLVVSPERKKRYMVNSNSVSTWYHMDLIVVLYWQSPSIKITMAVLFMNQMKTWLNTHFLSPSKSENYIYTLIWTRNKINTPTHNDIPEPDTSSTSFNTDKLHSGITKNFKQIFLMWHHPNDNTQIQEPYPFQIKINTSKSSIKYSDFS